MSVFNIHRSSMKVTAMLERKFLGNLEIIKKSACGDKMIIALGGIEKIFQLYPYGLNQLIY